MNKTERSKLIYSGKYQLPLEAVTKKSYKILVYKSKVKCANINKITIPELPDNYYILTSDDLTGSKNLTIGKVKIPVLARHRVNYIGEPILLIIGYEIEELLSLYKKIDITFSEIAESNTVFFSRQMNTGENSDIFKKAFKVISGNINTPTRSQNSKLLHGALTKKEADNFTIYSSGVWASDLKKNLSDVCKIDKSKLKVISPLTTGDDESNLIENYRSAIYTTIASSKIKKNVIHYSTPEDQYLFSLKEYGLKCSWKAAYNEENELLGLEIKVCMDCGAYPILVKEKVYRIIHGLTSFYRLKNIQIHVEAVKSHKPPVDIIKGFYLSEANFICEILVSKIIKSTNSDQFIWRRDNLMEKGYKSNTNSLIKSNLPLKEMLNKVVVESDFSRKNSSINLSHIRRNKRISLSSKRGIAISIGYNANTYISNDKSLMSHSVTLRLNRDNKVDIIINTRLRNLKLLRIWEDIISSLLDIEKENIKFITDDSTISMDSGPNFENKNISILTPLIRQCCEEIKVRRFKDPLPITRTKTSRRVSSLIWNPDKWKGEPLKNSSFGVCAVEVEIDKRALETIIKEIWMELEVGQIVNKMSIINEINREITETINWLKNTEPVLENGLFKSEQFFNRRRIKSKPIVHINFLETGKSKSKPKGIGSLIKSILPGAYLQSVNQALGANLNSFPITREIIYRELKRNEV